jgi:hypothetical protein
VGYFYMDSYFPISPLIFTQIIGKQPYLNFFCPSWDWFIENSTQTNEKKDGEKTLIIYKVNK